MLQLLKNGSLTKTWYRGFLLFTIKKISTFAPILFEYNEVKVVHAEVCNLYQRMFNISHQEQHGICSNLT